MLRPAVALALTWVAGFVDTLGYLLLSGVYTGNMSGNTVLVGVRAVGGDLHAATLYGATLAAFVAGLFGAGILLTLLERGGVRRLVAAAMGLEALSLAALLACGRDVLSGRVPADAGGWRLYLLIAAAAVAMGIQNTSLRTAGVLTVYTTHVTGTLTRLSEDAVGWLLGPGGRARRARATLFSLGLWLAFLLGAFAAAAATGRFGMRALLAPLAVIAAVFAVDCTAPLRRKGWRP